MIILPTKNLTKILDTNSIALPEFANQDALWHGNIFMYKRKKVLHLTHEASRYTIFIYGITKKDIDDLPKLINEHLRYHILQDSIPLDDAKYILSISEHFSYFKKTNRQVLGTMNNMKLVFESLCNSTSCIDDKDMSHKINQMLFKIGGEYKYPSEVFKEYMHEATLIHKG